MQHSLIKLTSSRPSRFILGLIIGSAVGGVILLTFSGQLMAGWIENIFLSFVTYGGFVLILFGYFYKRNGQKNFTSDFALGCGIGLILVWFVNAGNGTITAIPLPE